MPPIIPQSLQQRRIQRPLTVAERQQAKYLSSPEAQQKAIQEQQQRAEQYQQQLYADEVVQKQRTYYIPADYLKNGQPTKAWFNLSAEKKQQLSDRAVRDSGGRLDRNLRKGYIGAYTETYSETTPFSLSLYEQRYEKLPEDVKSIFYTRQQIETKQQENKQGVKVQYENKLKDLQAQLQTERQKLQERIDRYREKLSNERNPERRRKIKDNINNLEDDYEEKFDRIKYEIRGLEEGFNKYWDKGASFSDLDSYSRAYRRYEEARDRQREQAKKALQDYKLQNPDFIIRPNISPTQQLKDLQNTLKIEQKKQNLTLGISEAALKAMKLTPEQYAAKVGTRVRVIPSMPQTISFSRPSMETPEMKEQKITFPLGETKVQDRLATPETISFFGGQEIKKTVQPYSGTIRTDMPSTRLGYTTDISLKDIKVDYSRGLITRAEEKIPFAGTALTSLSEQVYLPDAKSAEKYKELITDRYKGKELKDFLREQQAQYKKDVGAFNVLSLKIDAGTATSEDYSKAQRLSEQINFGIKGSGWDVIRKAAEQEGTTKARFLAGGLKAGTTAYGLEKTYLGFQLGGGLATPLIPAGAAKTIATIGTAAGKLYVPATLTGAGISAYKGISSGEYTPYVIGESAGIIFGSLAPYYGGKLATLPQRRLAAQKQAEFKRKMERFEVQREGEIQQRTKELSEKFFGQKYKSVGLGSELPKEAQEQLAAYLKAQGIADAEAAQIIQRASLGRQTTTQLLAGGKPMRPSTSGRWVLESTRVNPATGETEVVGLRFTLRNGKITSKPTYLTGKIDQEGFGLVKTLDLKTGKGRTYSIRSEEVAKATQEGSPITKIKTISQAKEVPIGENVNRPYKDIFQSLSKEQTAGTIATRTLQAQTGQGRFVFTEQGAGRVYRPSQRIDRPVTSFEKRLLGLSDAVSRPPINRAMKGFGGDIGLTSSGGAKSEAILLKQQQAITQGVFRAIPVQPARIRRPSISAKTQALTKQLETVRTSAMFGGSASLLSPVVSRGKTRDNFRFTTDTKEATEFSYFTEAAQESGRSMDFTGLDQPTLQAQPTIEQPRFDQPVIQEPVQPIPSPVIPTPTPEPPKPPRPPVEPTPFEPFGFGLPERKKKGKEETPFDAQVRIDATKGSKARWQTVANNVPLITALSKGGQFVDETASNRFRVVPQKGKLNRVVDTTWNALQNKFREYTTKSGIKVGLRPRNYIEKRQYRIDQAGERRAIPQLGQSTKAKARLFRL